MLSEALQRDGSSTRAAGICCHRQLDSLVPSNCRYHEGSCSPATSKAGGDAASLAAARRQNEELQAALQFAFGIQMLDPTSVVHPKQCPAAMITTVGVETARLF